MIDALREIGKWWPVCIEAADEIERLRTLMVGAAQVAEDDKRGARETNKALAELLADLRRAREANKDLRTENERLQAHSKQMIDHLKREIEHLRLDARAFANVLLSEENDALIEENKRLRAEIELVSK